MRLSEGKHNVEVLDAFCCEAQSGTLGITFKFVNDYGEIDCTRWVTQATRDHVIKDLETLGIPGKALEEFDTLMRLGEMLRGNRCQIVCEPEEYRGQTEIKVKWINDARAAASSDTVSRVYAMLTGKVARAGPTPERTGPTPAAPRSVPVSPPSTPPPVYQSPPSNAIPDDDVPF